jgi:hypothetical protein
MVSMVTGGSVNSWLVWLVAVVACVLLGFVGYHFTVRILRFVAALLALALAVVATRYGVAHHGAGAHADLVNSFTQGFDALSNAFFRPLLGHNNPVPGRIGWLVIIGLLVFGYRELEVWAMRWQPPTVDLSALGGDKSDTQDATTTDQCHDLVANEIRFRLPAVAVRAPAILPGGTKVAGLVSIAESTGNTAGGLAGAVINFAGALWPSPRQYQIRIRVEPFSKNHRATSGVRVTVDLEHARTGGSIATKTLPARRLDEAGSVVAGYVARQIFSADPSAPPWCYGSFDGSDLAAMLIEWQVRTCPKSEKDICRARAKQRRILEKGASSSICAGVTRYELAQLYDIDGLHAEALRLHAINREQYPRFYRGRYRLGMSLEMLANPKYKLTGKKAKETVRECLDILDRCHVTRRSERRHDVIERLKLGKPLPRSLRIEFLKAAQGELREVRRQLAPWHLIWSALVHRDERAIWKHYWSLTERERFHDGVRVAELLVAVRQSLDAKKGTGPRVRNNYNLMRARWITTAITDDKDTIREVLKSGDVPPPGQESHGQDLPHPYAQRTRWVPWQHSTPSWQAAYNTACLYAALARGRNKEKMAQRVVGSLIRAINDSHCEIGRPSEWLKQDPDFSSVLRSEPFRTLLATLREDGPQEVNPMPADP